MDGELRTRKPSAPLGEFNRTEGREPTRRARPVAPAPEPEPSAIFDADDLGVQLSFEGDDPNLAPGERVHEAGEHLVKRGEGAPVEIPLRPRSLIPSDVLEAIASEEAELLAQEDADADDDLDRWVDDDVPAADPDGALTVDDADLEVVSERTHPDAALDTLKRCGVLSALPAGCLDLLSEGTVRHHLVDRQPACRERTRADSFFIVERGVLEMVRTGADHGEVALNHLHPGEAFGLFGLLCRKQRVATVRAIGEVSVLELRATQLDLVARSSQSARTALARYFKEKLLENFLAVSPIFRNLDALGRAALISHFQDRKVAAGEVLVTPGEVQNGIALVTSGLVAVFERLGPGRDTELAKLQRGQYYGVVSALCGMPTRANIVAREPTTLCELPQRSFNEFVKGYPVLRNLPARLGEAGQQVARDVFVGDATAMA